MAKLAEYDKQSLENHSDGHTLSEAIGCMEAIINFPVHDITTIDNHFDISGFEKSFWGKNKLKAYCKVSVIDDHKLVITIPAGTDDIPPYYDVAIGFDFSSDYESYLTDKGFFILGTSRKIVLSYYWLIEFINAKMELYKGEEIDAVTAIINDEMLLSLTNMQKTLTLMKIKAEIQSLKYKITAYE